jgi:DNA-binding response OmpR family regulator
MSLKDARKGFPPNSTVRVLQIGDDPELAESRALVLENAGFLVEHCASWEIRSRLRLDRFDIFLFCQSVDPQSAGELAVKIRREAPRALILRMRSRRADYDHLANLYLSAPAEPRELIHAVELLASRLSRRPEHRPDA